MAELQLKDIHKSFGNFEVIKGVSLEVHSGEFMVFVGPSGCGKSTLLRLISGLEDITSGTLSFDGKVVNGLTPSKRGIAMVFQSYALYPHMTVYENMAFGMQLAKASKEEMHKRILQAAELLQIDAYLDRLPKQLSGGQRQRVAIGRAIVREPKAFLFDEPLSNLDAALRVNMRLEISELHQQLKTTMVYVTHDQVEAMTMADRIVVLNAGHIEQYGTPMELYRTPANRFVAGFIGSPKMNFIDGADAAKHGAHSIGVRPEHLHIGTEGGTWTGRVQVVEHLGSDTFVYVNVDGLGLLTVRVEGEEELKPGQTAHLTPDPAHIYRFDKAGVAIR